MIRISEPCDTSMSIARAFVLEALERRQLSGGTTLKRFEQAIARAVGVDFALATSSGTTALHLAMLTLGVQPGDEVIVPACSYIAVANAVRYCGARPVFADVDPRTWTLTDESVERAMTGRTVGVISVSLYGVPSSLSKRSDVWLVEDMAEAIGTRLSPNAVLGVLSFYGNKIVPCGEGGALVARDADLHTFGALLRGQGQSDQRYVHVAIGYNYRMSELSAAAGLGHLDGLKEHLTRRASLRNTYDGYLSNSVEMQDRSVDGVDWVMPVLVPNRDDVADELEGLGIETRPVFPALHQQPIYFHQGLSLPVAERLASDGLLLPLHCNMTVANVIAVCNFLLEAVEKRVA